MKVLRILDTITKKLLIPALILTLIGSVYVAHRFISRKFDECTVLCRSDAPLECVYRSARSVDIVGRCGCVCSHRDTGLEVWWPYSGPAPVPKPTPILDGDALYVRAERVSQ